MEQVGSAVLRKNVNNSDQYSGRLVKVYDRDLEGNCMVKMTNKGKLILILIKDIFYYLPLKKVKGVIIQCDLTLKQEMKLIRKVKSHKSKTINDWNAEIISASVVQQYNLA